MDRWICIHAYIHTYSNMFLSFMSICFRYSTAQCSKMFNINYTLVLIVLMDLRVSFNCHEPNFLSSANDLIRFGNDSSTVVTMI